MKKIKCLTIFLILIFVSACGEEMEESSKKTYGEINGWEAKHKTILVETNPPEPKEVGVKGTESREDDSVIEEHDLKKFGKRWNEAAEEFEQRDLAIDKFDITYTKIALSAEQDITGYLTTFVSSKYEPNYIRHAGVEWRLTEYIVGEKITNAWTALIYATVPDMLPEELLEVIDKLGISELSAEDFELGYEIKKEINDYEYDFYATDKWGEFIIRPIK